MVIRFGRTAWGSSSPIERKQPIDRWCGVTRVALSLIVVCLLPVGVQAQICGDGVVDPGEQCDTGSDRSDVAADACRSDCRKAYCGDSVVDSGEQCDDGRSVNGPTSNTCREDCTLPFCGDGVVDDGVHGDSVFNEECDDGNSDDSDGCTVRCKRCLQLGLEGNIEIMNDTDLCPAEYHIDDYGDYGVIIIKATGVTLDCHGATLIGEGRGVGIVDFRSNDVTIRNCGVRGFDIGLRVQDGRNVLLENNRICGNSRRDVDLIDAEDIHGYRPAMATSVACGDVAAERPGNIPPASVVADGGASSTTAAPSVTKPAATIGRPVVSKAASKSVSPASSVAAARSRTSMKTGPLLKPGPVDLFVEAANAVWTSRAGKIVFGSDRVPEMGMAQSLPRVLLANGRQASHVLVVRTDEKNDGFVQGVFPLRNLRGEAHVKTTVALRERTDPKAKIVFEILVDDGTETRGVMQRVVAGKQQITLDGDLSRWAGKDIRLILRVRQLQGSKPASAVWVSPVVVSE